MENPSSMSGAEKRGYLKALGVDLDDLEEGSTDESPDSQTSKTKAVSIGKEGFSRKERYLLQKGAARVWGALSVTFHGVLRAAFVGVEVDEDVVVKVRPRTGSNPLNPLSVREAVKLGLDPFLQEDEPSE